jgi:hypothetical protein
MSILIYKKGRCTRVVATKIPSGNSQCARTSSRNKSSGTKPKMRELLVTIFSELWVWLKRVRLRKSAGNNPPGKDLSTNVPCRICLSTEPSEYVQANVAQFDTDSYQVKVDTGCSVSLSGVKTDFSPGTLKQAPPVLSIQSYGGSKVPITHIGTIKLYVLDDQYQTRAIVLPRSLKVQRQDSCHHNT